MFNKMKQIINQFRQSTVGFDRASSQVRSTWQDSVAESFYAKIVEPLKEESSSIATAMDDLSNTLEMLKGQIDSI